MNTKEFRASAHQVVDWMADYFDQIEDFPVMSQVVPGQVKSSLKARPPEVPEAIEKIMSDFQNKILPGITHWQHPSFFGYFPANNSKPSILAEMITATIGAQCMMWITSPAATELEELTMEWIQGMCGLPSDFTGVIQETASAATLCALLTAREKASGWGINKSGFDGKRYRIYCSEQAHSSIQKAARIAGLGEENVIKIPVDENYALLPVKLSEAIMQDIADNHQPCCIVAAVGTTGSTAIDPVREIGEIAKANGVWLHVDAAYAGNALILPEMRWMAEGIENADSLVLNPHKWLFTNFDCSVYFVKDTDALLRTFTETPEYLKTKHQNVKNFKDWGIQLGRRFRALKLWFVIRSYGTVALQEKIRKHIALGKWFASQVKNHPMFQLMAPVPLNTVCFRYNPGKGISEEDLERMNRQLMDELNTTGKIFITHTKLKNTFVLRMVAGQTEVKKRHVESAWENIVEYAGKLNFS